MPNQNHLIHILCVEDSEADRWLIREFLAAKCEPCEVHFAEDGEKALDYLYKRGAFAGAPDIDLILLDLNLPRVRGRDVLQAVKSDARLQHIPVIVLSSSSDPRDVADAYNLHANCYLVKPNDIEAFQAAMDRIEQFWLRTTELCHGQQCA